MKGKMDGDIDEGRKEEAQAAEEQTAKDGTYRGFTDNGNSLRTEFTARFVSLHNAPDARQRQNKALRAAGSTRAV